MTNSTRVFMIAMVVALCGVAGYMYMDPNGYFGELLSDLSGEQEGAGPTLQGLKVPGGSVQTKTEGGTATTGQIPATFNFEDARQLLALLNESQRKDLLDDQEKFKTFLQNEATGKSVFAAAQANNIDKNDRNQLIAKRGAENILREIYIKQLLAANIPKDYPSEEQISAFYEKNKDKFTLGDRMPVWQIFLSLPQGGQQKEIELLKKRAESIINDLAKGTVDFAKAALKYSEHKESKFNGGFMGLVQINNMKPEILKTLTALDPDKISSPITSDEGVHIMKRGPQVDRQELQLVDVHDQIRKMLLNQARKEIRNAIYQQASSAYPVNLDDQRIEEWRLKLRTSTPEGGS